MPARSQLRSKCQYEVNTGVNVRKELIIDLGSGWGMNIFSNAVTAAENTTAITNNNNNGNNSNNEGVSLAELNASLTERLA